MFLVDDILLSPVKGFFYLIKQVHKAAEEEFLNEESITAQLSELYMMLDTGRITEEEFDKREAELLNRLDEIEEYKKAHFEKVSEEGNKDKIKKTKGEMDLFETERTKKKSKKKKIGV